MSRSPATPAAWPPTRPSRLPEHGQLARQLRAEHTVIDAFAAAFVEQRDLTVYDRAVGVLMASMKPSADVAYLCRALKAPSLAAAVERLAERARTDGWTHEEFLAACLEREVAARAANGGELRIRAARFPARKSLDEFDFDHQRSLKRDVIAHLATLDFVAARDNVVFLGPPGTGKTHLAIGLSIRACQPVTASCSPPPPNGSTASPLAHSNGRLHDELRRLGRYPLIVIDEVGYIPFEPEAANLFFQLISARYERASRHRHLATSRSAGGARPSATTPSPPP